MLPAYFAVNWWFAMASSIYMCTHVYMHAACLLCSELVVCNSVLDLLGSISSALLHQCLLSHSLLVLLACSRIETDAINGAVCVFACVCEYMFVCIYTPKYTHLCMYVYIYIYTHTQTRMLLCVWFLRTYTCTCAVLHPCIHLFTM